MTQSIDFELNEETDEFHLILDGEDKGAVDMDDLREAADSLHIHFHMFRYAPEYQPEDDETDAIDTSDTQTLTDEEIEEELAELENLEDEIEE